MLDLVIHKFADWGDCEIFMLREDLLPIACGGNKVRIALKLVEDARRRGANTIIGYGNCRSNLCRVLAMICASEKLKCVIVSPSDDDGTRMETTNSRIVGLSGADVIFCRKGEAVADVVQHAIDDVVAVGGSPYYIFGDRFGNGNERVLRSAYEEVAAQIFSWSVRKGVRFDRIALAVGTGATYGGLLNGFRAQGSDIPVTGYTIARDVSRCRRDIRAFTEFESDVSDIALNGGYGKTSPAHLMFLRQVADEKMLLLDSTYAGKALWGLYRQVSEKTIGNERILFLHTGSLPLAIDGLSAAVQVRPLRDVRSFPVGQYEMLAAQMPDFTLRGDELTAYIGKMVDLGNVFTLSQDGRLLGLIGFYANDLKMRKAYLSMLVVDSSLQGTGAANVLFARLREEARERGMRNLNANVVKDNARAIRYYAKQGLCVVGPGQDDNHVLVSGELDSSGLI